MGLDFSDVFSIQPHRGQKEVLESVSDTRVVAKGRQWGGTTLVAMDVAQIGTKSEAVTAEVITPTKRAAGQILETLESGLNNTIAADFGESMVEFGNGSSVKFKRSEMLETHPPSSSPAYVAVDMADHITPEQFKKIDRYDYIEDAGKKLFVGSPHGRAKATDEYPGSWLFEKFIDGFMADSETESWQFPTYGSPHILREEIEYQRRRLDEVKARQEFDAAWIGESGE